MKFCVLLMILGLMGCSHFSISEKTNKSNIEHCQYPQRDLTTQWNERLYWCDGNGGSK
ncbi:Uncharacterised protein [Suttonella ornithocola]|uniref:Lipoprotein n=1 Tax=Suttonella ornithocola TaxID=279832 RepID=A0A380MVN0_9GAMM|nr:Uncharacterised protein [Suttonella ornithocola]